MEKIISEKVELIEYGKNFYSHTLTGVVHKYLKEYQKASTTELMNFVKNKELFKSNRKKYSLNEDSAIFQALLGLSSTNIFNISKDSWSLNEAKAKEYKKLKIRKYCNDLLKKEKNIPFIPSKKKVFKKVKLLQKLSQELKNKKESFNSFPLKGLNGDESINEAEKMIGKNRLFGLIEGYLITVKYCKFYLVAKIIDKKYENSPYQIQDKLVTIQKKLKKLGKGIIIDDN